MRRWTSIGCAALASFALIGATPPPSDTPQIIEALKGSLQAKKTLEVKRDTVQQDAGVQQSSVTRITQEHNVAIAPINARLTSYCTGTYEKEEYQRRLAECTPLAAQAQKLVDDDKSRVLPYARAYQSDQTQIADLTAQIEVLARRSAALQATLNARFPRCGGGARETVVDCYQHIWDSAALHSKRIEDPVVVGGRALGVVITDDVTRGLQAKFNTLEAERARIDERLNGGTDAMTRHQLKTRLGEIGNEQSYLRFKAKEHERATTKPGGP